MEQITNLTTLRESLQLTQAAAARRVGVDRATWHRWEKGRYKPDELSRIAMYEAFGAETARRALGY